MYKTVYDLSCREFEELKENYANQLEENGEEFNGDVENIPDDVIYEHYEGISFVKDDFFCNILPEET